MRRGRGLGLGLDALRPVSRDGSNGALARDRRDGPGAADPEHGQHAHVRRDDAPDGGASDEASRGGDGEVDEEAVPPARRRVSAPHPTVRPAGMSIGTICVTSSADEKVPGRYKYADDYQNPGSNGLIS